MAARPLEAPRSLPSALQAAASAITGRARPPLFTTGPATRNALAAAGALGATTGTVVHLPSVPQAVMSPVLAHELMHTRSPVRRPRFFLDGVSGLLDDDERKALDAGRSRLAPAAPAAAGIVDRLPVGGGLGAVGDVATRAAKAAVLEAGAVPMSAARGLLNTAQETVGSAVGTAAEAISGVSETAATVGGAVEKAVDVAKHVLDADKVVEIVEARLLREIERRGGRWAGMF